MLTPRENMFEVFRCGFPQWIPLTTHVDPYNQPSRDGMDPDLAEAMGTVRWQDENTVRFSRYLGIDILDYLSEPVRIDRPNVTVDVSEEGDDRTEVWHTPKGDLRSVRRRCRQDGTSYLVEHLVTGPDDLPALAAVFEDEIITRDDEKFEQFRQRRQLIGDDGMLMCFMPGTPLGMMYRVFSGVEPLIYLEADAPEALADLLAVMETNYSRRLKVSLEADADAYVGMDDTSTTIISPKMFEQHNVALTDARADACHQAGKLYFHHSCGLIRDLLPVYRTTKMDAVHAFTPPPTGNVEFDEGRKALGDRIAICGLVKTMANETWDQSRAREEIEALFDSILRGDWICLNAAAYPHRTVAQTQFVVDQCRRCMNRQLT